MGLTWIGLDWIGSESGRYMTYSEQSVYCDTVFDCCNTYIVGVGSVEFAIVSLGDNINGVHNVNKEQGEWLANKRRGREAASKLLVAVCG